MLSLVALVIAGVSTLITYLVYRSARTPEVVVYAHPDDRRPSLILIVIENVGRGMAHNVSFTFDSWIPYKAYGLETKTAKMPESMTTGPLRTGIPSLGPGSKRIVPWGQFGGLSKALGESAIDVTATYDVQPILFLFPHRHTTTSRIDVKSFQDTMAAEPNWDKKAAEALEKIATTLENLRSALGAQATNTALPGMRAAQGDDEA